MYKHATYFSAASLRYWRQCLLRLENSRDRSFDEVSLLSLYMNSPLERCRQKMSGANWKRTFSKKVLSVQLDESDPFGPQAFIRGARVY